MNPVYTDIEKAPLKGIVVWCFPNVFTMFIYAIYYKQYYTSDYWSTTNWWIRYEHDY